MHENGQAYEPLDELPDGILAADLAEQAPALLEAFCGLARHASG